MALYKFRIIIIIIIIIINVWWLQNRLCRQLFSLLDCRLNICPAEFAGDCLSSSDDGEGKVTWLGFTEQQV